MEDTQPDLEPARERTDRGLADERAKTDLALHQESVAEALIAEASPLQTGRAQTDDRLRFEREETDRLVDETKEAVAHREGLLALVSHELRSPLTAIGVNTQLLLDRTGARPGASTTKKVLDDIGAGCTQMTHLVSDLLDVASMESGTLKVTPARGDLIEVMREAVAASAPLLQGRFLALTEAHDPVFAWFDRTRLLQVFANLLANAVKFTSPGARISVSVAEIENALQFCVADTGSGIPREALPNVFERFWQLGRGDRRGLGLGLYLCKAIVEAHGGKIWVASEERVGSSFFFTVPV